MEQVVNNSENGISIKPRVDRLENGDYITLVRRLTFKDGYIVSKELLSENGEWINIPEGGKYPKECCLKSSTIDRRSFDNRLYNWPSSNGQVIPGLRMYPQQIELE